MVVRTSSGQKTGYKQRDNLCLKTNSTSIGSFIVRVCSADGEAKSEAEVAAKKEKITLIRQGS